MQDVAEYDQKLADLKSKVVSLAQGAPDIPGEDKKKQAEVHEMIRSLKESKKQLKEIQSQQNDLEMMLTEDNIIDQLLIDIEPHKKLWDLHVEYKEKTESWLKSALKKLNPEEVE